MTFQSLVQSETENWFSIVSLLFKDKKSTNNKPLFSIFKIINVFIKPVLLFLCDYTVISLT